MIDIDIDIDIDININIIKKDLLETHFIIIM